jgi:hypothetical protein
MSELIEKVKFRQDVFPGRESSGLIKIPRHYEGFNPLSSGKFAEFSV